MDLPNSQKERKTAEKDASETCQSSFDHELGA